MIKGSTVRNAESNFACSVVSRIHTDTHTHTHKQTHTCRHASTLATKADHFHPDCSAYQPPHPTPSTEPRQHRKRFPMRLGELCRQCARMLKSHAHSWAAVPAAGSGRSAVEEKMLSSQRMITHAHAHMRQLRAASGPLGSHRT